jgi:hypothetical protein
MPLHHQRLSRPAARGQRRKLVWATFDQTVAMGAGNQVKIVDLLNQFELAGVSKLGCTVVRTHLRMLISTALISAFEYAIGVNPITTVGTLLPNPNADNDLDWMIFERRWPEWSGATVNANFEIVTDLRSKRKIEEMGQTLTLNLWAPVANAGSFPVFCRTLVALP